MLIIIGIAGAAALSVLVYNAYRESRPDMARLSAQRAQQLAAVVLVFSKTVEGVIEALAFGLRPDPVPAGRPAPRRLVDAWDDEDYT